MTTRLRRLVVEPERLTTGVLTLEASESRYLRNVLRMSAGTTLEVRDGMGSAWDGTLRDKRTVLLGSRRELPECAGPRVHLCFAPAKAKRVEVLLEKATELGAASLRPVWTSRGVRRAPSDERWRRIVREAARQCGAARAPALRAPVPVTSLTTEDGPRMIADPSAELGLGEQLEGVTARDVTLLTGPEGGFAPAELEDLTERGWLPFSLGDRILRAETAPLVALTIVRHRLSNLG